MLQLDIRKKLDEFELDVGFSAPEGKIIVLFGPSGAGKSLTLAAIGGLLTPDTGRIRIGELVLFDAATGVNLPPARRRVGLVKQDLALFPHLTVEQNVAYGLYREPPSRALAKANAYLEVMHLQGLEKRRPSELSGGQQQRVALARALAMDPTVLLLDEPFSALDLPTRTELREQVKTAQHQLHTNVIFVTHDFGEAYLLADYLAVMDRGRVLQFDLADSVFHAPQCRRAAEIVGVKNILPVCVMSSDRVRVGHCDLEVDASAFPAGQSLHACIRPERITLVRKDRPPSDLPNVFEGELIAESNDGTNVILKFRADKRLLSNRPFDLEIDTPVYVYERLNLAEERHWTISIKPSVIHLIPE